MLACGEAENEAEKAEEETEVAEEEAAAEEEAVAEEEAAKAAADIRTQMQCPIRVAQFH